MEFYISNIVNFLVVVFILFKVARKPTLAAVSSRSENIKTRIAEAEAQFAEADKKLSQWKQNWESAGAHASRLMEDAKASLELQRQKAVADAEAQARRIIEDSKRIGSTERQRAREQLEAQVVGESLRLATSFLEKSLGEPERKRLVEEALELVGERADAK